MSAIDVFREADEALRIRRDAWRREEAALMAERDRALRELVGSKRGGLAAAARELEVSDSQVFRLLDDGIIRAVKTAFDAAGVERSEYQLTRQRGSRSVGVVLTSSSTIDAGRVEELLSDVGMVFLGLQPVSSGVKDSLRDAELQEVRQRIRSALDAAGISSKLYKLTNRRGDGSVRLTLTSLVAGLASGVLEQVRDVLDGAGMPVAVGPKGTLLVSSSADDDGRGTEMLYGWVAS